MGSFSCSAFVAGFCSGKYAGHYEDPGDETCYVVCNKFGRAYSQRCALGTKWTKGGDSKAPSGYNRCA